MKLIYPAIFTPFEEGEGYTVVVPDLPGCVSEGLTLPEAIEMGTDAASGWILDELEDGNPLPKASNINDVCHEEKEIVNLLLLDMDTYAEQYGNKAVRKNVTIPAYMETFVINQGLSLSKLLQDIIKEKLLHSASL